MEVAKEREQAKEIEELEETRGVDGSKKRTRNSGISRKRGPKGGNFDV